MRAPTRAIAGFIAAAALASVSTFALAQAAPPAGPPTAEQREAWKAKAEERMHEHMAMHAKHLHDLLQLRPDQDAALQTLMASMAPSRMVHMGDHHMDDRHMGPGGPEPMDHHMGPGMEGHDDFARLTTPERLDKMAAMMAEHSAMRQAEFQKHAEAIKAFYAVLSPEQKRAFDAMPEHMMGGMHGEHEGHGGMGHHMGAGGPHGPGGPDGPPPPQ